MGFRFRGFGGLRGQVLGLLIGRGKDGIQRLTGANVSQIRDTQGTPGI